jgi:hypothetical protein
VSSVCESSAHVGAEYFCSEDRVGVVSFSEVFSHPSSVVHGRASLGLLSSCVKPPVAFLSSCNRERVLSSPHIFSYLSVVEFLLLELLHELEKFRCDFSVPESSSDVCLGSKFFHGIVRFLLFPPY